jgi:hypothetical protein
MVNPAKSAFTEFGDWFYAISWEQWLKPVDRPGMGPREKEGCTFPVTES